jgi:cell division protein FtsB
MTGRRRWRMSREKLTAQLEVKRTRLTAYLNREAEMLNGGVQSYGVGSRNLMRYNTELSTIRATIKQLEDEIAELENALEGKGSRRAVGVVPRDW